MALQSVDEISDILRVNGCDYKLIEYDKCSLEKIPVQGTLFIVRPPLDTSDASWLCTLKFSSGKLICIKKHNEYDLLRLVKFNVSRDVHDGTECNVCMNDVQNLMECLYCNCALCSKCTKALCRNHVLKCPLCGTYSLQKNTFGTPFREGEYIGMPKYLTSAKAQMRRLLEMLDGKIEIVYSIDGQFDDPTVLKMCRFPLTNKYCDRYMNLRQVLETLARVYDTRCYKTKGLMNIYMFRQTYKMKEGNALTEVSSFRWTSQRLIQYPSNAWEDIFFEMSMRFKQKIEYLYPVSFVFPEHIVRMFREIHSKYPGVKDGYLFGSSNKHYSLVFSVDEDGNVARDKQPIVARHMLEFIDRDDVFYLVFCSINDPHDTHIDILTYRVSSRSSIRLTHRQNVHFCRRINYDSK